MFRSRTECLPVVVIVPAGPCVNIRFAGSTVILSGPVIALGLLDSLVGLPAARANEHYRCLHPVGHTAKYAPRLAGLPDRNSATIKLPPNPPPVRFAPATQPTAQVKIIDPRDSHGRFSPRRRASGPKRACKKAPRRFGRSRPAPLGLPTRDLWPSHHPAAAAAFCSGALNRTLLIC
jgi:hypothetical protein